MYEWNEAIQRMIDWVETHLSENPTLLDMSRQIGYSPTYCSSRFHALTGTTLKTYVAGRRLARAALLIRDTDERILDIAVSCGYSSQEALTRAFTAAFSHTPAAYRRRPVPLPLPNPKVVFFPEHYADKYNYKGESTMCKTILTDPTVRVEYIPAHKYVGIWDLEARDYMSFWGRHDCDTTCGTIDSMSHVAHPVVGCHTAGWFYEKGKKGYFYGFGTVSDYAGPIPDGFEARDVPAGYYLVFSHPPFDFLKDCAAVMNRVEDLAWNFDPASVGFRWDEDARPDYQRHLPETLGYEVLRPVKKLDR